MEENTAPAPEMFTQAQVDELIAIATKAMDEATKAAEARAAAAETAARSAAWRAELKGQVVDVDAALRLMDEEKDLKDGVLQLNSLLERYPFLSQPASTTPPPAGGVQQNVQLNDGEPAASLAAALGENK